MQLGNVKGDAAVLADQEKAFAPAAALCALNDNDVCEVQPSLPELFYLRRGLAQPSSMSLRASGLNTTLSNPPGHSTCARRGR